MHETGVFPYPAFTGSGIQITQWHGASSPGRVFYDYTLKNDPDKLLTVLLFVDGHSQQCDLSPVIKKNPARGLKPGKHWMWYKPLK